MPALGKAGAQKSEEPNLIGRPGAFDAKRKKWFRLILNRNFDPPGFQGG